MLRLSMINFSQEIWTILALSMFYFMRSGIFQKSRLTYQFQCVTIILAPLNLPKINVGNNEHNKTTTEFTALNIYLFCVYFCFFFYVLFGVSHLAKLFTRLNGYCCNSLQLLLRRQFQCFRLSFNQDI